MGNDAVDSNDHFKDECRRMQGELEAVKIEKEFWKNSFEEVAELRRPVNEVGIVDPVIVPKAKVFKKYLRRNRDPTKGRYGIDGRRYIPLVRKRRRRRIATLPILL